MHLRLLPLLLAGLLLAAASRPHLALAAKTAAPTTPSSYCSQVQFPIPRCVDPRPRDLLFLVDGSNSMNSLFFFSNMLDYTLALFCAFDPDAKNQAGMILFRKSIDVVIPLGEYTRTQWQNKVNQVRASPDACCSCCTPTAEAFDAAGAEFDLNGKNEVKIAFVITDGVPSNNNEGGNPAWRYVNKIVGYNPARYNYGVVPARANALKNKGVRLFLVGVPDVFKNSPDMAFFRGQWEKSKANPSLPGSRQQCVMRDNKRWCAPMRSPPFPIVSEPVALNSFTSTSFNVEILINKTLGSMCQILPTRSPTLQPTRRPTKAVGPTTRAPSRAPTTNGRRVTQVDLSILLDRSKSMVWHDDYCKGVISNLAPLPPPASPSACWELFTRYVVAQAEALAATKPPGSNVPLGWASDFPGASTPARGIRVSVWGFACRFEQRTPVVIKIAEQVASAEALRTVMNSVRVSELPDGGTCPGKAIEAAVRLLESTPEDRYPAQAAVYVTDGAVYDEPAPERAVRGLFAYDAATFSVGVAVPKGSNDYGLSPAEVKEQRKQLLAFADGKTKNVFAFAEDGFDKLTTTIAQGIAAQIPGAVLQNPPIPRYSWCGWRRKSACALAGFRFGKCRWIAGKDEWGCRPKA